MPIVFDTSALLRPAFTVHDFTATEWSTADEKADFAGKLRKFIAADFQHSHFTKILYRRLSFSFGHIAHCDSYGFFDYFFRDLRGKIECLEDTLWWRPYGDSTYTFCGVEHAVQTRLKACNLLAAYRALRAAEVEGAERELLRRLQAKYDDTAAHRTATDPRRTRTTSIAPASRGAAGPFLAQRKKRRRQGGCRIGTAAARVARTCPRARLRRLRPCPGRPDTAAREASAEGNRKTHSITRSRQ
jgi:hypothetical protein